MPKPIGPRKIYRYSAEFKATAVALSRLDGVAVQDVARELDIHPFMLSRWRKQARDGELVAPNRPGPEGGRGTSAVAGGRAGLQATEDGARALKKSDPVRPRAARNVFEFLEANRNAFPVSDVPEIRRDAGRFLCLAESTAKPTSGVGCGHDRTNPGGVHREPGSSTAAPA